jgi:hypothetical protein
MCKNLIKKRGCIQRKTYTGNTIEKNIQELDLRKVFKYLGIEDSHDKEDKNEKEKLKTEYLRRLRLVLGTE